MKPLFWSDFFFSFSEMKKKMPFKNQLSVDILQGYLDILLDILQGYLEYVHDNPVSENLINEAHVNTLIRRWLSLHILILIQMTLGRIEEWLYRLKKKDQTTYLVKIASNF